MIVLHKADLKGTGRSLKTPEYETTRFLLREDGVGLTLTDITLKAGVDVVYEYENHVDVVYCLAGTSTVEDLATGEVHQISRETLWALPDHDSISLHRGHRHAVGFDHHPGACESRDSRRARILPGAMNPIPNNARRLMKWANSG